MIKELKLTNILSYGPESPAVPLGMLNLIIGPNGSGKSNFLEALGLIKAAPSNLPKPVKGREGGGPGEWLWKQRGKRADEATIDLVVEYPKGKMPLRHRLSFTEVSKRFQLTDEAVENADPFQGHDSAYFYYRHQRGNPVINAFVGGTTGDEGGANGSLPGYKERKLRREDIDPEQSILAQRREPDLYPELNFLASQYEKTRLYTDWSFGRTASQRLPQPADLESELLSERCDNLGLVLAYLKSHFPGAKREILTALTKLYDGIEDYDVYPVSNTVQVILQETAGPIPSTRLSDGTMRFLCLLAILCHPEPPPLVSIEEPELGLHPDLLPAVARLLREASTRTQLIVTTHSDSLVDAFTETPEVVLVCEKTEGTTHLQRLSPGDLRLWLEKYTLGQLWRDGVIGGTRW